MELSIATGVLCIAVGGIAAQWLAWRLRLPAIVLLFAVGLAVGPGLQILHPTADFGPGLRAVIGLAVAIVVFEGGLALDLRELGAAGEGVLRLTVLAVPVSWLLGTVAAHYLGAMGWGPAVLFGAITIVTGPTVVLPLLRHTRLQRRAASFLKWEAIVNDPIGALLAALMLEILAGGGDAHPLTGLVLRILLGIAVAAGLGVGTALILRWAFLRDQVPEILKTPILLATTLGIYAVSNVVMNDSGLIAATLFGVALVNLRVPGIAELRRFKEALVVLLVSALFIVLTADLNRNILGQISWPVVVLIGAMLFLVRPAAIFLATLNTHLTIEEKLLSAWIAPRGIVAAAVAGVAGLRLQTAGYPGASTVMPAVFLLIATTMVLHGFTLRPLARRLKLTLGEHPGLAIIGASDWTTDLAAALSGAGVPVLLVDIFPGALDRAHELALPTLQAEILSEQGAEALNGRAVDYLLAATPDDIYNGLVCARLGPELGHQRVFQLAPAGRRLDLQRGVSRDNRGKVFGPTLWDFAMFEDRAAQGWRFKIVESAVEPAAIGDADSVAFIVIHHRQGALHLASVEDRAPREPGPGDTVLVFAAPAPAVATEPDLAESPIGATGGTKPLPTH